MEACYFQLSDNLFQLRMSLGSIKLRTNAHISLGKLFVHASRMLCAHNYKYRTSLSGSRVTPLRAMESSSWWEAFSISVGNTRSSGKIDHFTPWMSYFEGEACDGRHDGVREFRALPPLDMYSIHQEFHSNLSDG
jgi:hypothetical protein